MILLVYGSGTVHEGIERYNLMKRLTTAFYVPGTACDFGPAGFTVVTSGSRRLLRALCGALILWGAGSAPAQQPFNLANNQTVNSGQALVGINPSTNLPSSSGWLYDFGAYGFTNFNMNGKYVKTDDGHNLTFNLGGGPIVAGGNIATDRAGGNSGNLWITNAQNIAVGALTTVTAGGYGSGSLYVRHNGTFSAASIDTSGNPAGYVDVAGNDTGGFSITNGNLIGSGFNVNARYISVQCYTGVAISGSLVSKSHGVWGALWTPVYVGTLSNPIGSGGIAISGGINTYQDYADGDKPYAQSVNLYTVGPVSLGGILNLGCYGLAAGEGSLTVVSSNGPVDIATVDMASVYKVKLSPLKYSYIQTLTNYEAATTYRNELYADAGKKVLYGGGGTNIVQLRTATNEAATGGGYLCPNFGDAMTADNSNSGSVFGPAITSRVTAATGYGGLRGMATNTVNSGGGGLLGTRATILNGMTSGTNEISMAWRSRTLAETNSLLSDVVRLAGTNSDVNVVQMSYSEALLDASGNRSEAYLAESGKLQLQCESGGLWRNAGGSVRVRAWEETDTAIGTRGVDTNANVVWAVVRPGGVYAAGLGGSGRGTAIVLK